LSGIRDYFVEKKKQMLEQPFKRLSGEEFRKKWAQILKEKTHPRRLRSPGVLNICCN